MNPWSPTDLVSFEIIVIHSGEIRILAGHERLREF